MYPYIPYFPFLDGFQTFLMRPFSCFVKCKLFIEDHLKSKLLQFPFSLSLFCSYSWKQYLSWVNNSKLMILFSEHIETSDYQGKSFDFSSTVIQTEVQSGLDWFLIFLGSGFMQVVSYWKLWTPWVWLRILCGPRGSCGFNAYFLSRGFGPA